jgi:uncharacterized membrane protein YgcG
MHFRTLAGSLVIFAAAFTPSAGVAQTAVNVSARVGDFHVAVANYYQVPEREVVVIRERRIPDDELPVVFFIAREARVPATRVMEMRQAGRSWWDISVRFGLRPDVYYVPVAATPGPPYGHAYGHYKKPKSQWKNIVLTDADVVNLVQLRFFSEHYRVPPERVIESKGRSRNVVAMYSDMNTRYAVKRQNGQNGQDSKGRGNSQSDEGRGGGTSHGNGNSQGNGKGNGRGQKG